MVNAQSLRSGRACEQWCEGVSACRKAGMGECRECEAALLCRDFLNLGYSQLLVDPGVRLAYSADAARQRYTKKVPGL